MCRNKYEKDCKRKTKLRGRMSLSRKSEPWLGSKRQSSLARGSSWPETDTTRPSFLAWMTLGGVSCITTGLRSWWTIRTSISGTSWTGPEHLRGRQSNWCRRAWSVARLMELDTACSPRRAICAAISPTSVHSRSGWLSITACRGIKRPKRRGSVQRKN